MNRRGFLSLLGLGAAAAAAPRILVAEPEPVRRFWQVSRDAPVARGAGGLTRYHGWETTIPVRADDLRDHIFGCLVPQNGFMCRSSLLPGDLVKLNTDGTVSRATGERLIYDGAPLFGGGMNYSNAPAKPLTVDAVREVRDAMARMRDEPIQIEIAPRTPMNAHLFDWLFGKEDDA